jgi:hypothetical protein
MDPAEFEEFLAALRQWNDGAVRRLVLLAEPKLSQVIRARLQGSNLNRVADPDDICQSVFFRFLNSSRSSSSGSC